MPLRGNGNFSVGTTISQEDSCDFLNSPWQQFTAAVTVAVSEWCEERDLFSTMYFADLSCFLTF